MITSGIVSVAICFGSNLNLTGLIDVVTGITMTSYLICIKNAFRMVKKNGACFYLTYYKVKIRFLKKKLYSIDLPTEPYFPTLGP